jgi:hypothetical protein
MKDFTTISGFFGMETISDNGIYKTLHLTDSHNSNENLAFFKNNELIFKKTISVLENIQVNDLGMIIFTSRIHDYKCHSLIIHNEYGDEVFNMKFFHHIFKCTISNQGYYVALQTQELDENNMRLTKDIIVIIDYYDRKIIGTANAFSHPHSIEISPLEKKVQIFNYNSETYNYFFDGETISINKIQ